MSLLRTAFPDLLDNMEDTPSPPDTTTTNTEAEGEPGNSPPELEVERAPRRGPPIERRVELDRNPAK